MILGAAIGFTLGIFLMGLIFLVQGKAEITKTRIVQGRMARLGGAICMIPIPLIFVFSLLTKPQDAALLAHFITVLTGWTGIGISVIGLVIGSCCDLFCG
jgi:hypothetical protein